MDNVEIMLTDMANTIIIHETIVLDDGHEREDLMGLYQDIRQEFKQTAPDKEALIYSYAALLQKELDLCTPRMVYEAGAVLGCNPQGNDIEPERAFMRYLCRIGLDPAARHIQKEIGAAYSEIHGLLGDTYSLIDEFTALYRKCNGIIINKLFDFFRLGYGLTHTDSKEAV